jgi:uncharacterized protein (DUF1499 family)
MAFAPSRRRTAGALLAWTGFAAVLGCAIAAAAAGIGYSLELWPVRTGFAILRWAVYIGIGAGVIALAGAVMALAARSRGHAALGLAGVLVALTVVIPPWNLQRIADHVPRIHDITTDTDNPPRFVALREVREKSLNGAAYRGEKISALQKAAYPDIRPALTELAPGAAFERALAAARRMGWDIAAAEPAEGRIEATATTFWFRFKDDVVIRITPHGAGSRLDIRSMSRLGRSDLGANAKRIRAFMAEFNNSW